MKAHDQEIMNHFNLGSLMQGHSDQDIILYINKHRGVSCFKFPM